MKNTDRVYEIKEIINSGKSLYINGVVVTSLMVSLSHLSGVSDLDDKGHVLYGKYWSEYSRQLGNMNYSFDIDFSNLYKNGKYVIDGKEYDVKELYLVTLDDDSMCLVKAGINYDIINKREFDNKKKDFVCLRDTKIFYDLFKDGYIDDNKIKIDIMTLKKYIDSWDGSMQYEIPELIAEREATKYIRGQK